MKNHHVSDATLEAAKSDLDVLEAAFAKKSAANARVIVKTNIHGGTNLHGPIQPIHPIHPQPLYGVIAG